MVRNVLSNAVSAAMVVLLSFFPKTVVVKASGDGDIAVSYDVVEKDRVDKHYFVL